MPNFKVAILEKDGVELEFQEELQLSSDNVSFTDSGDTYKTATDSIKLALEELRTTQILKKEAYITTLNGTLQLVKDSYSFIDITGSATGYTVKLPDASTIVEGRSFVIVNDSSETIEVQDFDGTKLFDLIAFGIARVILQFDSSTAGQWITDISSTTATGIVSETIETATPFSTNSSSDVIITGMSIIPQAGRYAVWFDADIDISQNNRLAQCVFYVDGTPDEATRRTAQGVSSNFNTSFQTIGIVNVNGLQTVEVFVNINGGNLDVGGRSLILIRLGQ